MVSRLLQLRQLRNSTESLKKAACKLQASVTYMDTHGLLHTLSVCMSNGKAFKGVYPVGAVMLNDRVMPHTRPQYGSRVPALVSPQGVRLSESRNLLGYAMEKAKKIGGNGKELTLPAAVLVLYFIENKGQGIVTLHCDGRTKSPRHHGHKTGPRANN